MDVSTIFEQLADTCVRVHYLALSEFDITSSAVKMTMQVLAAEATKLLIERT